MFFIVAAVGGSYIFLGFMLFLFVAVAFGYYTIRGSGIDAHPSDGLDGAPGSGGPSDVNKGRASDREGTFSSHGTG